MEIYISQLEGRVPITQLRLVGDYSGSESVLEVVQKQVDEGTEHILLDLKDAPFISSAGLRSIYSIYELLERRETAEKESVAKRISAGTYKSSHLKLIAPSKNGLKALAVGGFDMFLEIFQTQEEAIRSF